MHLSDAQKQRIVAILQEEICSLQACYLFGSYADGSAQAHSDADIAFLSETSIDNLSRWKIAQTLARALGVDVDLVDLKKSDTILRYQIISTAIRLYGGGYEVESFETLAYSFYLRFSQERRPIVEAMVQDSYRARSKDA